MTQTQQKKKFLASAFILRYLTTKDDEAETLVLCQSSEVALVTTDQNVYEALSSVQEKDEIDMNKLKKFFEVSGSTGAPGARPSGPIP